jgi:hypothetical protein
MPKQTASVTVRTIIMTPPQGESVLMAQVDIDCEVCGVTQGNIWGHHLRTLVHALQTVIDENPELCGDVGKRQEVTRFAGESLSPEKAKMN